jgi:D-glycero-D-manno-heptose 1,7-bisphosphate phosphatase
MNSIKTPRRKTFFFDRDGIVNQRIIGGYITSKEDFVFIPDIFSLFRIVKDAGFLAILVTNQQGIGKGLMSERDLAKIHAMMQMRLLSETGSAFDDIYVAGERDLSSRSGCCSDIMAESRRKPSPAMLLEADEHWGIDLAASWMLGDSRSDAEAGRAAGVRTILVGDYAEYEADIVVPSLSALLPQMPIILALGGYQSVSPPAF